MPNIWKNNFGSSAVTWLVEFLKCKLSWKTTEVPLKLTKMPTFRGDKSATVTNFQIPSGECTLPSTHYIAMKFQCNTTFLQILRNSWKHYVGTNYEVSAPFFLHFYAEGVHSNWNNSVQFWSPHVPWLLSVHQKLVAFVLRSVCKKSGMLQHTGF